MTVSIVVAQAKNGVIGRANDLPWYLPADLKHFKELTLNKTVVMGRKTFESIIKRRGSPLPNRQNIVLTKDPTFTADGVDVAQSLDEAMHLAQHEVCIIGGAQIYEMALPIADVLHITEIHANLEGDTYFPLIQKDEWSLVSQEDHPSDEKNQFAYSFVVLKRKV